MFKSYRSKRASYTIQALYRVVVTPDGRIANVETRPEIAFRNNVYRTDDAAIQAFLDAHPRNGMGVADDFYADQDYAHIAEDADVPAAKPAVGEAPGPAVKGGIVKVSNKNEALAELALVGADMSQFNSRSGWADIERVASGHGIVFEH